VDSTFPVTEMCGDRARGASRPPDGEAIRLLCVDGEGEGRGLADRLMRADDRFEVVTDRSASRALAILAGEPPDQRRRSSCATPDAGECPRERPATSSSATATPVVAARIANAVGQARAARQRARADRLEALLGRADGSISVVDVNRTALGLVDATAEEVSGTPFPETPWWNHSPAADELGSWIDRAAGGEPVRFSAVHRLSSGDRIPVDGVLHPIRDDDGEVVEETEPVGLGEQVRTAWGHVDTGSADLVVESDLPFAADPDRLQHVLENLIRDAIEHGGDGVTVRVGRLDGSRDGPGGAEWNGRGDAGRDVEPGEATGSEAGFYVEDDGPGLPPGQADGAFEPGETSGEASGLGLRIVGRMVDAHGWGVTPTESRTGGARFEVTGVDSIDG